MSKKWLEQFNSTQEFASTPNINLILGLSTGKVDSRFLNHELTNEF